MKKSLFHTLSEEINLPIKGMLIFFVSLCFNLYFSKEGPKTITQNKETNGLNNNQNIHLTGEAFIYEDSDTNKSNLKDNEVKKENKENSSSKIYVSNDTYIYSENASYSIEPIKELSPEKISTKKTLPKKQNYAAKKTEKKKEFKKFPISSTISYKSENDSYFVVLQNREPIIVTNNLKEKSAIFQINNTTILFLNHRLAKIILHKTLYKDFSFSKKHFSRPPPSIIC